MKSNTLALTSTVFMTSVGDCNALMNNQLEPWTPHDDDEAWVCQFGSDTWLEYQFCRKVAQWLDGSATDILARRMAQREQAS